MNYIIKTIFFDELFMQYARTGDEAKTLFCKKYNMRHKDITACIGIDLYRKGRRPKR